MNFERNLSPKAAASDYLKLLIMYAAQRDGSLDDDSLPMPIELMSEHDVRKWWADNFDCITDAFDMDTTE